MVSNARSRDRAMVPCASVMFALNAMRRGVERDVRLESRQEVCVSILDIEDIVRTPVEDGTMEVLVLGT